MTVFVELALTDAASPGNEVLSDMGNAFEWWMGQQVVVQLAFGQIKVSLRGKLLQEQKETLLMRPEGGSDVEIEKIKVLAIEQVFPGRTGGIVPINRACPEGEKTGMPLRPTRPTPYATKCDSILLPATED